MENIIQTRFNKLRPFLSGIIYEAQDDIPKIYINLPKTWSFKNLESKGIVLEHITNEKDIILIIGNDGINSIDTILDIIQETIEFNQKIEKKRKLLLRKMKELESMTLDDIDNLDSPKFNEIGDEDVVEVDEIIEEEKFLGDYVHPLSILLKNVTKPIKEVILKNEIIEEECKTQSVGEPVYTPLYQNQGKPMVIDPPITISTADEIKPHKFNEDYMYEGYEVIPDDPNDPENDKRLKAEYYRKQNEMVMRQRGHVQQQDQFPNRRDPLE